MRAGKTSKGDKLGPVDHAKMNYRPFRRNFYIEVPELSRMTEAETAEYRTQLDGIKARISAQLHTMFSAISICLRYLPFASRPQH